MTTIFTVALRQKPGLPYEREVSTFPGCSEQSADARKRLREAEAQAEAAAAQRRPHAADEKLTALKLRARMTQIYKHKNAKRLADVESSLAESADAQVRDANESHRMTALGLHLRSQIASSLEG